MALNDSLNIPVSASAGAAYTVATYRDLFVQVGGTWTGSLQIEGTIDNIDWAPINAAVTTNGIYAVATSLAQIRVNTTSVATGTPTVWISGHEER